jgi:glycosyltransferase involved in cell wall biosynthesis
LSTQKKVVCFFESLPPSGGGGAALRGKAFAEALVEAASDSTGFDVTFLTSTAQPHPISGVTIKSFSNVTNEEQNVGLLKRSFRELMLGVRVALNISKYHAKETTLVVSSPSFIAACVVCLAAIVRKIPYVLDVRDIYPQAYVASGLLSVVGLPNRVMERLSGFIYRKASLILAATKGLASEIERYRTGTRVEAVLNGFPKELLKVKPVKHDKFTVCFHGVLGFFQDVESIKILAKHLVAHDVNVVVIGYGRKTELIENASLQNLRFLGRLPFPKTIEEVAKCHVGLCLRLDESISRDAFPVKVWEYLGLGIPTIVTPYCEAGAFLEKQKCGLQFKAGAIDEMVAAILELKTNSAAYELMQKACQDIREGHTREAYAVTAAELICAREFNGVRLHSAVE